MNQAGTYISVLMRQLNLFFSHELSEVEITASELMYLSQLYTRDGLTQDEMAYERTEMSSERTALAEERTAMAIERTEMAFERTSLTNSQTLLAYTRTAIALLAAGIGMFEFVSNQTIVSLGVIIMLLAPVLEAIGLIHFFMVRRKLKTLNPDLKPQDE